MRKRKIQKAGIIGHFGNGLECLDGQTVKTKTITNELEELYGSSNIRKIDTHGGIKRFPGLAVDIIKATICCRNVIILPAQNGLRVIAPLVAILCNIFKKNAVYVVIGGWLSEYLDSHGVLLLFLKRFGGIYVETERMKMELLRKGLANVKILRNCKRLKIVEVGYNDNEVTGLLRICTFSRVNRGKGIEEAINAVKQTNGMLGRTVYELDIYGNIEEDYRKEFECLMSDVPTYIHYMGSVPYDRSTEILKKYFFLLFPTRYYTEGIPGTVIDAYASGVPVVASKWENFEEVIRDGVTGFGFEFNNIYELVGMMIRFSQKPEVVNKLRNSCIMEARKYDARCVMSEWGRTLK